MLGEILEKGEAFKKFTNERALEFASLEDAYITSRYFIREFTKEEAERLRKFSEEVEEFVRGNFN